LVNGDLFGAERRFFLEFLARGALTKLKTSFENPRSAQKDKGQRKRRTWPFIRSVAARADLECITHPVRDKPLEASAKWETLKIGRAPMSRGPGYIQRQLTDLLRESRSFARKTYAERFSV